MTEYKFKVLKLCVCVYLSSVFLLLQRGDSLLQGAAGSLLLLYCRPQLLLKPMALSCKLAHFDLNAQTDIRGHM